MGHHLFMSWCAVGAMVSMLILSGGCGGDDSPEAQLAGTYQSTSDKEDRIELLKGGKARVVAYAGQGIDVWELGRAGSGMAGELQAARQANRTLETVEGRYKIISPGKLQIEVPGRGSRILTYNAEAGTLQSPGRNYLSRN